MDTENVTPEAFIRQAKHPAENSGEIQPRRKVGVVIVRSAELGSSFFHGPRPARNFPVFDDNEDWERRLTDADCFEVRILKGKAGERARHGCSPTRLTEDV